MRLRRRSSARLATGGLVAALVASVLLASPASAARPQAPGGFTGHGFDTCVAPDQATMDTWALTSPFSAVGIYVSGSSRYCGDAYQPNLSAAWVAQNARNGWRFMPIHVGRQAPCYASDPSSRVQKQRMSTSVGTARKQARSEAAETIAALKKYGFAKHSTSFLDIEHYPRSARCDRVVLEFVDAWTEYLHKKGYRSGLYGSGSSVVQAVDEARRSGRKGFSEPDQMWFAWGNGKADVKGGPYLSRSGWKGQRLHQYELDVRVAHGGRSLLIDRDYLDVGRGSRATQESRPCGTSQTFGRYATLRVGTKGKQVKAVECMLRRQGFIRSADSRFTTGTARAVDAFAASRGLPQTGTVTSATWTALLSSGRAPFVLKQGSTGSAVWRLQRALAAAGTGLRPSGVYDSRTVKAVRAYRAARGLPAYPTVEATVWSELQRGATL